ncbi:unnamed protein product [Effrenium voratum]|nr:unnamed protein product [Effrenium voratum]
MADPRKATPVLTSLCKEGDVSGAIRLLSRLRRQAVQLDAVHFRVVLFGAAWAQSWRLAAGLLADMAAQNIEESNEGACGASISACKARWALAEDLLAVVGASLRQDARTYSNTAGSHLTLLAWETDLCSCSTK